MTATDSLTIAPLPLSARQLSFVEAAETQVDAAGLRALVADMVDIASPTGEEGELARYVVGALEQAGVDAQYQPIDAEQANAAGKIHGTGRGPSLLLYAPLDTVTVGDEAEDCPGVGPQLRADMRCAAEHHGDWVVGLGASNPKGHAACVVAAAQALARSGTTLRGDLLVGLCAGGMPTNRRPGAVRANAGQGNGCSFLLEQGYQADFALITKPGWSVAWEEVGLCWFQVRVGGLYNYVGSRHRIAYRNPIVDAAVVVAALEEWSAEYARRNTSGLVAPQAQIGAIEAGWTRMPSFCPASCSLLLDVRISPRTTPADVQRQFAEAIDRIRAAHPEFELTWDMIVSIPGTSTPPDSWIVQAAGRAWEDLEDRPHEVARGTSGATDANILRSRGIPTARVGMPKVADESGTEVDFAMGMNAVDVRAMVKLTRLLIRTAVQTCDTTVDEVFATGTGR